VSAFATAGAGFLLAVLWFDLMFDVQVIAHRGHQLPEDVLSSIAGYYRRVTTSARPMNRLIALVMLTTLVTLVVEVVRGDGAAWVPWASLATAAAAIGLAGTRTVPSAVRLGTQRDPMAEQSRLAYSIYRQHMFCAGAIAALLVLQLAFAG
jgi:hypothetical protein